MTSCCEITLDISPISIALDVSPIVLRFEICVPTTAPIIPDEVPTDALAIDGVPLTLDGEYILAA